MANQILARLGIVMAVDSAELEVGLSKAKEQFKGFTKEVQRQSNEAAKETMALKMATETYGKSLTAVQRLELEMKYGKYAGNMMTAQQNKLLREQAAAYDAVKLSADKANAAKVGKGGLTPQMSAALGYQTTDIITGLAGGQNPFMVLLQQGGQLRDQFGGFKPLFQGIAEVVTFTRVAMVGLGAAIAGLGYAFYRGSEDAKQFNAALALTNNYAGMTYSAFNGLAATIGDKYGQSIGNVKGVMQGLVSSGQFTAQSIVAVTEVISSFAKVSGESASVVAEKLTPAFDGTANSAAKLNSQYHFLTVEQYKQIDNLEKQGKFQDAIVYTADAFNKKLVEQQDAVGPLAKMWHDLSVSVSNYYEKTKGLLSGNMTSAEQLEKAALHYKGMVTAFGEDSDKAQTALREYYALLDSLTDKAAAKADQAKTDEKNLRDIEFQRKYGERLVDIAAKTAEDKIRAEYAIEATGLDAIKQLKIKAALEDKLALAEIARAKNKDPQIAKALEDQFNASAERKKAEARLQAANINRDELLIYSKKADAEQDALNLEQDRLNFAKEHLLYSGRDLEIAQSQLKTRQEIAMIERDKKLDANPEARAAEIERLKQIQRQREGIINQRDDLKRLQDMNASVFSNMSSAIDTFVRTGKFAFKDFARSVIQDLIAIAMKAQMMAMFKGFSFFGPAAGSASGATAATPGAGGYSTSGMQFADGGAPPVGMASLVGENGPELFIPSTAGTIIPNGALNGMGDGGGQTINYNGPFIQNMSAIDTQSGIQFLTKNKSAVWAANQSAQRSLPVSR